jgi:hypothetical protein
MRGLGGIAIGTALGVAINAIGFPCLQSQTATGGTTNTISTAVYIPWHLPVFTPVFSV